MCEQKVMDWYHLELQAIEQYCGVACGPTGALPITPFRLLFDWEKKSTGGEVKRITDTKPYAGETGSYLSLPKPKRLVFQSLRV
jgi:hypothetical protein